MQGILYTFLPRPSKTTKGVELLIMYTYVCQLINIIDPEKDKHKTKMCVLSMIMLNVFVFMHN